MRRATPRRRRYVETSIAMMASALALSLLAGASSAAVATAVLVPDRSARAQVDPDVVWKARKVSLFENHGRPTSTSAQQFIDIDFPDPDVGYALASGAVAVADSVLLKTEDGGRTWQRTPSQVGVVFALDFLTEDIGYVASLDGLFMTTDGGSTFVSQLAGHRVDAVSFATPEVGWVLSRSGAPPDPWNVLMTEDGGDTWLDRGAPPGQSGFNPPLFTTGGGATPQDRALFFVSDFERELYRSDDGGSTWTHLDEFAGGFGMTRVASLSFLDARLGYVVGKRRTEGNPAETAVVGRTDDGGETWVDVTPSSQEAAWDFRDVAFLDDQVGHVVGTVTLTAASNQPSQPVPRLPLVLTTVTGGQGWTAEPVDLSAFVEWRRDGARPMPGLQVVAVAGDTRVAAGDYLAIVQRTTDRSEWPPDPSSACIPPGMAEPGTPEAAVCEAVPEPLRPPSATVPFEPEAAQPCEVGPGQQQRQEFPCVGQVQLRTETGDRADGFQVTPETLMHDPALGRFVAVSATSTGRTRIYLFDAETMRQRGVEGFGEGFGADSAWGSVTGVVNFQHVDADVPERILPTAVHQTLMPVDPESGRHLLALVGCGAPIGAASACLPASLVTVSLTGEFLPRVGHAFQPIDVAGQPYVITSVVDLAYDEHHRILYVLTEANPHRDASVFGSWYASSTEPRQVLHALDADPEDAEPGELRPMWSLPIDPSCKQAAHARFDALEVSEGGRAVAFACQGADFPFWGFTTFTPHGIHRVELPQQLDPRDLGQSDTESIAQRFTVVPGRVGATGITRVSGAPENGLLLWRSPANLMRIYDFANDRWIGSMSAFTESGEPTEIRDVVEDGDSGRLYVLTERAEVRLAETVNLPASTRAPIAVPVQPAVPAGFDPATRRLVGLDDAGRVTVFEDRVGLARHLGVEDPDDATNDIPEEDAGFVDRDGLARSYGSRVWWSGFRSALPGYTLDTANGGNAPADAGNWEWIFQSEDVPFGGCNSRPVFFAHPVCHGYYTTRMPGSPGSGARELLAGRVSGASLSNSESRATAASQSLGDTTGNDVQRRRLLSEWHDFADAATYSGVSQFEESPPKEGFDDGHDDFDGNGGVRELERCSDEGVDRAYRELDGERRVSPPIDEEGRQPDECFAAFDEGDPRGEHSGVMGQTGFGADSHCADTRAGEPTGRDAGGSTVECDHSGWRTEGSAELSGFTLRSPEGQPQGWLTVGSSSSSVEVVRDPEEGIVAEARAVAGDIDMGFADQGSMTIGEVRMTARSWAKGRPGTAGSWVDVAFEDVVVTDAAGARRFSCGRAEPGDPFEPDPDLHHDEGDGGTHGACDPHAVVDAINRGFGDRVQATTPHRDGDELVAGSPGGARAIVRRAPEAFWSDFVLNGFQLWELPALQLTIFNDGAEPNRLMVDLAAVYTESSYEIGRARTARDGGGEGGDSEAAIAVELADSAGNPLAGGHFALVDGAGAPAGSCATDVSGACRFDHVAPGPYRVAQVAAPEGYLAEQGEAEVFAAGGSEATVRFVNLRAAGGVALLLTDPEDRPLAGGRFELVADLDADGQGGRNDPVMEVCATDGSGTCAFPDVELGAWVVRQAAAPEGFEPSEPVGFALTAPGQVARLHVVNAPPGTAGGGADVEVLDDVTGERISVSDSGPRSGGLPRRLLALPGEVARFLVRNPGQALLFALVGIMVGAPAYLAARRREMQVAKEWS